VLVLGAVLVALAAGILYLQRGAPLGKTLLPDAAPGSTATLPSVSGDDQAGAKSAVSSEVEAPVAGRTAAAAPSIEVRQDAAATAQTPAAAPPRQQEQRPAATRTPESRPPMGPTSAAAAGAPAAAAAAESLAVETQPEAPTPSEPEPAAPPAAGSSASGAATDDPNSVQAPPADPPPAVANAARAGPPLPIVLGPAAAALQSDTPRWVSAAPSENWFIQLRTVDGARAEDIDAFIESLPGSVERDELRIYVRDLGWGARVGIIYGDYPTRDAALDALGRLPAALRQDGAYPRQVKGLR